MSTYIHTCGKIACVVPFANQLFSSRVRQVLDHNLVVPLPSVSPDDDCFDLQNILDAI